MERRTAELRAVPLLVNPSPLSKDERAAALLALDRLSTRGLSATELSWMRALVRQTSAVADPRLMTEYSPLAEGLVSRPEHPSGPDDPFRRLETTSWCFQRSPDADAAWAELQQEALRLLTGLPEAPSEAHVQHVLGHVASLRTRVFAALETSVSEMCEALAVVLAPRNAPALAAELDRNVIPAGSGSDALCAAHQLLAAPGAPIVTSLENGSKFINFANGAHDVKINPRALDNRALTTPELADAYLRAIHALAQEGPVFVSLTAAPKTGIYDPDMVLEVARVVAEHNRNPANRERQITLVVDAVQVFGRAPSREAFRWLEVEGVAAVVTTGSKAAQGLPHGGFLWLSPRERQRREAEQLSFDARGAPEQAGAVQAFELLRPWPLAPQAEGGAASEDEAPHTSSLLAALRGIDNARAIRDMLLAEAAEYGSVAAEATLFSDTALELREAYARRLNALGLTVLKDPRALPSIITFDPGGVRHEDFPSLTLSGPRGATLFVEALAQRGVAFGGVLKEEGRAPLFRAGLNRQAVAELARALQAHSSGDEGPLREVEEGLDRFVQDVREAAESALRALAEEHLDAMRPAGGEG